MRGPGMNKSIFRKLLLSHITAIVLGLGAIGILISSLVKGYLYDAKQQELLRKAKKVNLTIQASRTIDENAEQLLVFLDQTFDARIWVFDRQGNIIVTSTKDEVSIGKSVAAPIVEKVLKGEDVIAEQKFEGLNQPMLSVVVPWGVEKELYGGIVLHSQITGAAETIAGIRETILWITLLGVLLSIALASYLSWSITRPLKKINRTASQIGMGDYSRRIELDNSEEIDDLANTVNAIAEKLAKAEADGKRQEQLRNDFLANASHELRTPLTAMQGFLEALQDGLIRDDATHKYYQVMYQETMHMNRLVDDLLDLTKLENRDLALAKHPVDMESLLRKVAFKFNQEASEKGIELKVFIQGQLPKAYGDQDRLEQIIANLVGNAVKFTEQGYVHINGEADSRHINIAVSDTGIGIAEADQELIWERFFKVDRGRSKKNKGTGLGMTIVKRLVELHDGKISLRSQLHRGSSFTVSIPIYQESASASGATAIVAKIGSRRLQEGER
jgi:signal transduction histidine kinase